MKIEKFNKSISKATRQACTEYCLVKYEGVELPAIDKDKRFSEFYRAFYDFFDHPSPINISKLFANLVRNVVAYSKLHEGFFEYQICRWVEINNIEQVVYNVVLSIIKAWKKTERTAIKNFKWHKPEDQEEVYKNFDRKLKSLERENQKRASLKDIAILGAYNNFGEDEDGSIMLEDDFDQSRDIQGTLTLRDGVLVVDNGKVFLKDAKELRHEKLKYRKRFVDVPAKIIEQILEQDRTPKQFINYISHLTPSPMVGTSLCHALGNMLLGNVSQKNFFILHGGTNSGKSEMLSLLQEIFPQFSEHVNPSILYFVRKYSNDPVNTQLEKFVGNRFALLSEASNSEKFDKAIIKNLSGNERVSVRPLFKKSHSAMVTATMMLATNELPMIKDLDKAFLNRMYIFPFRKRFFKSENDLRQSVASMEISDINAVYSHPDKWAKRYASIKAETPEIICYLASVVASNFDKGNMVFRTPEMRESMEFYIRDQSDESLMPTIEKYMTMEKDACYPSDLFARIMRMLFPRKFEKSKADYIISECIKSSGGRILVPDENRKTINSERKRVLMGVKKVAHLETLMSSTSSRDDFRELKEEIVRTERALKANPHKDVQI